MTGLDKILEDIAGESAGTVEQIRSDAAAKVSEIMRQAEAQAEKDCAAVRAASDARVREAEQRAQSAAQLSRRKKLLEAKQTLIGETLQLALQQAKALPAENYFSALIGMAARAAHAGEGEMRLGEKDLARLPADFESRLNAALSAPAHLKVSARPAELDGGFILDYNGIEENNSFDAVFAAKHDELQDAVCRVLFS